MLKRTAGFAYQLYSIRREWFVPRYIAFLKNGFNQPAAELLNQFLGIDLTGQAVLNDDLELLNRRLDENGGECQGEVNSKVNSEQA